jgi:hypothetical protein
MYTDEGPEACIEAVNADVHVYKSLRGGEVPLIVKMDCDNGYGNIHFANVLEKLYGARFMKNLARLLFVSVGIPVTVLMRNEEGLDQQLTVNDSSLMQGDVLSPIFFSLAILPAIEAAREELRRKYNNPQINYRGYIDDLTWILPNVEGIDSDAAAIVNKHLKLVGAKLKAKKQLNLFPKAARTSAKRSNPFIDVLGIPVTGVNHGELVKHEKDAITDWLDARIRDGSRGQRYYQKCESLCSATWQQFPAQAIWILMKQILPSATYLMRNAHPELLLQPSKSWTRSSRRLA